MAHAEVAHWHQPHNTLLISPCHRFDRYSLAVIIANTAMLAIYDPLDATDSGSRNKVSFASHLEQLRESRPPLCVSEAAWRTISPAHRRRLHP